MSKSIIITQSNYIPWKGYFDSMAMVDEFMLYDDMQYTRRDWRNRNQIKTAHGLVWLTIPVEVKGKYTQTIKDTKVSDADWNQDHWNSLKQHYAKAACFAEVKDFIGDLYAHVPATYLSEINLYFLRNIATYLGITTPFTKSSDYNLVEGKTERLVNLCQQRNAHHYYTGPAAKDYMDLTCFEKEKISVNWLDYSGYPEYRQLHPPFTHYVSILDLLFNEGANAKHFMKYTTTQKDTP